MIDICWFSTGRDEEAIKLLRDVIEATKKGKIKGRIALCFLNREIGESSSSDRMIEEIKASNIPVETLSSKRFLQKNNLTLNEGRTLYDQQVLRRIQKYHFDFIFLAGYMLIISNVLFERFTILNLHPSLPGKYKGKWEDVIRRTIEDGERSFGAMIHIVSEKLDEGPPVTYCKAELSGDRISLLFEEAKRGNSTSFDELFRTIREKEFSIETPLILETLSALSTGELRIIGKDVYWMGKRVEGGVDLTERIMGAKNGQISLHN